MTAHVRCLLRAATLACAVLAFAGPAAAAILVLIPGMKGDSTIQGYENWFVADSFSFGVEREMKESGEKGGTADINIGVGELQECTISKSMDRASAALAQFAINGNSLGAIEIAFVQTSRTGKHVEYLRYKLDRAFVKSWSTSGDADDRPTEEVAFYYNKIGFNYSPPAGKSTNTFSMGWDRVTNKKWSPDLEAATRK